MENLASRLEEVYGGRKWVLAAEAAAATKPMVDQLRAWGGDVLVVSSNPGVGDQPDAEVVLTGSRGSSIVDGIRAFYRSVEEPDRRVTEAVDSFDPGGQARVLAEPHATLPRAVGRGTYGVRHPEWAAWEDKILVSELWDRAGVAQAPYRVVEPEAGPEAAAGLSGPLGTVWVADNTTGWHGGGEYVRWVADDAAARAAARWFASRSRRVRVMPFLEGLPCSIHGWVARNGAIAVFEPVEISVMRRVDRGGFVYAGVCTTWAAPDAAVAEMRGAAGRVGAQLRDGVSYVGPFGIDGVLTGSGFRPTELNPRMSVGAAVQMGGVGHPMGFVMRAEIEGDLDLDPVWLERTVIGTREPRIHFGLPVEREVRDEIHVTWDGGAIGEAERGEGTGVVTAGPSSMGSYITGRFDSAVIDQGAPAARVIAATLNHVSRRWDLGIPEVEPSA